MSDTSAKFAINAIFEEIQSNKEESLSRTVSDWESWIRNEGHHPEMVVRYLSQMAEKTNTNYEEIATLYKKLREAQSKTAEFLSEIEHQYPEYFNTINDITVEWEREQLDLNKVSGGGVWKNTRIADSKSKKYATDFGLGAAGVVIFGGLTYLGYRKFIKKPEQEAKRELKNEAEENRSEILSYEESEVDKTMDDIDISRQIEREEIIVSDNAPEMVENRIAKLMPYAEGYVDQGLPANDEFKQGVYLLLKDVSEKIETGFSNALDDAFTLQYKQLNKDYPEQMKVYRGNILDQARSYESDSFKEFKSTLEAADNTLANTDHFYRTKINSDDGMKTLFTDTFTNNTFVGPSFVRKLISYRNYQWQMIDESRFKTAFEQLYKKGFSGATDNEIKNAFIKFTSSLELDTERLNSSFDKLSMTVLRYGMKNLLTPSNKAEEEIFSDIVTEFQEEEGNIMDEILMEAAEETRKTVISKVRTGVLDTIENEIEDDIKTEIDEAESAEKELIDELEEI